LTNYVNDQTRFFSISALAPGEVWMLDRGVFQQIMMQSGMKKIEEKLHFLKSVPLFSKLSNDVLLRISDALEVVSYFLF
jgi:cGMP-dependent protein kinase